MSEIVVLPSVDAARGFHGSIAQLIDADSARVFVHQRRRRFEVAVARGVGSEPAFTCSCGLRPACAHVAFAREAMTKHAGTREWLRTGTIPHTVEAEGAPARRVAATAPASGPAAAAPARAATAAPARIPAARSRAPATSEATFAAAHLLAQWRHELDAARAEEMSAAAAEDAARVLLFQVTPTRDGRGLEVSLASACARGDGGWSRSRQVDFAKAMRRGVAGLHISPQDLGLLAALHGRSSGGWRERVTLSGDAANLVLALVDTGRCHLEAKEPRPLARGEPRQAGLGWETDAAGVQRPRATVDRAVPLLFDEPLYVDAAAGEVGALQFALPLPLVRRFLGGAAVSAELAGEFVAGLAGRFAKLRLPPPRRLVVERGPAPPPRPRLVLYSEKVVPGHFLEPVDVDGASLAFVYGAARFPEAADGSDDARSYREVVGDRVRVLERRFDLERAAAIELERLGFRTILDTTAMKHRHVVRSSLAHRRSLADRTLNATHDVADRAAWERFLGEERRRLAAAGWEIEIEPSFRHAMTTATSWFLGARSLPGGGDWFDFEVGIVVDGTRCDLLPVLLHLAQECKNGLPPAWLRPDAAANVVVPMADGRKVMLSTARLRHLLMALLEMQAGGRVEKGKLRLPRLLAPQVLALEQHVDEVAWPESAALRALGQKLAGFSGVATVAPPRALEAELRSYQREGLAWLQFLREHGFGGILADDMGLGKTVQALAHVLTEKAAGRLDRPCLVVAPTSVIGNWAAECARFAPSLVVLVLHGANRSQEFAKMAKADVVLTTYPLVVRDVDTLQAQPFHLLILDEAQAIKNAGAKAGQVLRSLEARHRLCLTGTPIENNLAELWAQFDFLMPGTLGDARTFGRVFRGPIEKGGDGDRRAALARRVRPFVLRRTKDVVAGELPPKTTIERAIELEGDQRDLYETIRLSVHERVRAAIEAKSLEQAQIVILDALLKLRQVCCDPRLVKLDAAKAVRTSAKLDALMELLPALIEDGRRILLFSQFTSMLALIEPELNERGIPFVQIVGDTKDRKTPVARFQRGEVPVFLISLKAGGTGLNLTAADAVIHYDPWWNPAVEQQATDRAHRIGQDKPVFVYKLIAAGTVEERIGKLQERKRALAAGLLDGGERQGAALTRADVEALFSAIGAT